MPNEKKYINADLLKNAILKKSMSKRYPDSIQDVIDNIPAADVAEVRHGEWIPQKYTDGHNKIYTHYYCSVCNRRMIGYSDPADCPYCHCGAKMDGESNAEYLCDYRAV